MSQKLSHSPARTPLVLALLAGFAVAAPLVAQGVTVGFVHKLSDFTGTVPYNGGRVVVDPQTDEIYVLASNQVRVFNSSGMETFSFGHDPQMGFVRDLAVDEMGDILVLSQVPATESGPGFRVTRCNYRGVVKNPIEIEGLGSRLTAFRPDRMFHRQGRLYLVSRHSKLVVVVDAQTGLYEKEHDLADLLQISEEKLSATSIVGFSIDEAGNMLCTIPVLFRAFVISPDGTVASFGESGSTPGAFSVAVEIVGDGQGHYFVADRGRSVVIVFDEQFQVISEFGFPGDAEDNLIRPSGLALGRGGRLYVTQMRNRGVSTYSVSFN